MRLSSFLVLVLVLLFVVFSSGCAPTGRKVVPVTGKITFKTGKPLPHGTKLLLRPVEGGKLSSATAITEGDGSFRMSCPQGEGVEVGQYLLILAPDNDFSLARLVPVGLYGEGGFPVDVKENMASLDLKVETRKR